MSNAPVGIAPVIRDRDVLAAARAYADQIADAELGVMIAGLEWAHRNPGRFLARHSSSWGCPEMAEIRDWEDLTNEGCPLVDVMSIPEFAYASGMSERVAQSLIHDAVVMFYRFPRVWARMVAGHVRVWRARLVPQYGRGQPVKVAKYVDRHLDQPGARFSAPNIQRLIDEARLRYVPDEVAEEQALNAEQRTVQINTQEGAHQGVADIEACLDLPDALDLEAALSYGAATLKELGSTETLAVRRAQALGDLARSAQTPLVDANPGQTETDRPHWDGTGVPRTGVKVYIHLNHTALKCTCAALPGSPPPVKEPPTGASLLEFAITGPGAPPGPGVDPGGGYLLPERQREDDRLGEVARVDGTGMPTTALSPELIRSWFTRPTTTGPEVGPKITVSQVIDPEEYVYSEAYEVPERVKSATVLRDRSCIFPFCHALAERSDCDHTTPFNEGGPTCTCNIGALCRRHHRLKTHGQHHEEHRWTYAGLGNGQYVWSGPNGIHLLRTSAGSYPLPGDAFATRIIDGEPAPGVLNPDGSFTSFTEDHAAFDVLTTQLGLPTSDENGTPTPACNSELLRKALRSRRSDPDIDPFVERYAARGKELLRPRVEYYNLPELPEDDGDDYGLADNGPQNPFNTTGPPPF